MCMFFSEHTYTCMYVDQRLPQLLTDVCIVRYLCFVGAHTTAQLQVLCAANTAQGMLVCLYPNTMGGVKCKACL